MTYSTNAFFGKLAMSDMLSVNDYIDWAVDMLGQGYDSPSLRSLAGLDPKVSTFEAEHYFHLCVKDLNMILPDSKEALRAYALEISCNIIDGNIKPKDGVPVLSRIYMVTDFDSDYEEWHILEEVLNNSLDETLEQFNSIAMQKAQRFIAQMKNKPGPNKDLRSR